MVSLISLLSNPIVRKIIPIWKWIVVGVAAAIAFTFVRAQLVDKDSKLAHQIEEVRIYKAKADSAVKVADSVTRVIDVKLKEANDAKKKADELSVQSGNLKKEVASTKQRLESLRGTIVDSIEMARTIIPLQDTIIARQDSVITTQSKQIEQLSLTIFKQDTALSISLASRDSLISILKSAPPPPKNPNKVFGILNLPSRKSVAIVTAISAVTVTAIIMRD